MAVSTLAPIVQVKVETTLGGPTTESKHFLVQAKLLLRDCPLNVSTLVPSVRKKLPFRDQPLNISTLALSSANKTILEGQTIEYNHFGANLCERNYP